MQAFPQSIYPELAELGGMRVLSGHLDEAGYIMGGLEYKTPQGWDYDLTLTNTGGAVLLQGTVKGTATTECARCLEPVTLDIEGEVQGYYLTDPEELAAGGYQEDEVDAIEADGTFDISYPLLAGMCYATPMVALCSEDCAGLCPTCGANLNTETCDCANAIDPLNPFAALAGLQFNADDEARGQAAKDEFGDAAAAQELADADDEPELSPEEAAELERALDAIFDEGASGMLEFDDEGNLVFIEDEDEEDEDGGEDE